MLLTPATKNCKVDNRRSSFLAHYSSSVQCPAPSQRSGLNDHPHIPSGKYALGERGAGTCMRNRRRRVLVCDRAFNTGLRR